MTGRAVSSKCVRTCFNRSGPFPMQANYEVFRMLFDPMNAHEKIEGVVSE